MSKNGSQGANYAISQNFLTSRATIQRCLSLARLDPQDTVLEIGTGKGHITRALAGRLPLTRRQVDTALRRARLQPLSPSANMRYVQWLCLFRAWQGRKGK